MIAGPTTVMGFIWESHLDILYCPGGPLLEDEGVPVILPLYACLPVLGGTGLKTL